MTIRKTIKWLLILVVLAAAGGGGYAYRLWNESNERIRTAILAKCAEVVPEWDVALGRARFDWHRRVHLYDLTLKARGQTQPIVQIPEIVISIDRERFAERQEVLVHRVRALGPVVDLMRDAEGNWNWQELQPPPKSDRSLPELEIEQATVRVRLDQTDGSPAAILGLQNANLKLIPSGKRQFLVTGLTQVSQAGKLTIDGSWDVDRGTGSFNGSMRDVDSSGELSGLVIGSSPELRFKLARAQAAVQEYLQSLPDAAAGGTPAPQQPAFAEASPSATQDPFRLASSRAERRTAVPGARSIDPSDGVPHLGASGNLDVDFKVALTEPDAEPEFEFRVEVKQGQIENEALPFPLRDLTGKILWDNRQFVLREMTAQNGMTRIGLEGRFLRQEAVAPGQLDLTVTSLMLDERLRSRLPAAAREIYDSVQPGGVVDVQGKLLFDGMSVWQPKDVVITFNNCTGRHVNFPYPVEEITGTLRQRGDEFIVELAGLAGKRPATLGGSIRQPGPAAEATLQIHVERLPLDETFVAACNPALQEALTALNLEGEAAGDITLHRPPGADQEMDVSVSARVTNASLEYVHFPYRLTNLQGDVRYSSIDDTWLFDNLSAVHGKARLAATASFVKQTAPGLFELNLTARNADIDRQLQEALPPSLQTTWKQLSPGGRLDLLGNVRWVPGRPAVVTLPEVKVTGGEVMLKALPYPLEEVETTFSYAGGQVDVSAFKGRHDRTHVRANGLVAWTPAGDWRVRLEELFVDDLVPDRRFRRALPIDLRTVVEELDPAGPISLDGMLELRGTNHPQDPVTAAWDVQTIHSGGKLTTGLDLEQVYGRVTSRGTWNGSRVQMGGRIDLDSVVVRGYQLTQVQGPYQVAGDQVIAGSEKILKPDPNSRDIVPPEKRIVARAIGGVMTFDASVDRLDEPTYHVKMTMSQGRLEQYAQRYMTGAKNLEGMMDGWIDLSGRGTTKDKLVGRGQLRINPAALYELPVIVQIVNVIGPPDNTAFRYALLDFDIFNSLFWFNTIDLVGDAFSLRGNGSARFDGRLNLDFYSMLPRNGLQIPIVSAVVGEATKGWVRVKVRGTTSAPVATVTPVPQVDEALKRFLGAFGTGPPVNVPRLVIPPFAPPQRSGPPPQPPPRTTRRM